MLKNKATKRHDQQKRKTPKKDREAKAREAAFTVVCNAFELNDDEAADIKLYQRKNPDRTGWPVYTFSDDGIKFVVRRVPGVPVEPRGVAIYQVHVKDEDDDREYPIANLADLGQYLAGETV